MLKLPALCFTSVHTVFTPRIVITLLKKRTFTCTALKMSDLSVNLTAPNGRKITLPTGIFINNEFVKSSSGEKITSINPTYGFPPRKPSYCPADMLL